MTKIRLSTIPKLLLAVMIAIPALAQMQMPGDNKSSAKKAPPLSPPAKAETTINGKKITIDYAQPSMRGRKIMGALVPYNQVWRTGANAATALTTEADLDIGGKKIPKGKYTLYTWPSEQSWKLIINKQTGQWGTEYDQGQDFERVDLKKEALKKPVETFTISFSPVKDGATSLVLEWENTRLSVPVKESK